MLSSFQSNGNVEAVAIYKSQIRIIKLEIERLHRPTEYQKVDIPEHLNKREKIQSFRVY